MATKTAKGGPQPMPRPFAYLGICAAVFALLVLALWATQPATAAGQRVVALHANELRFDQCADVVLLLYVEDYGPNDLASVEVLPLRYIHDPSAGAYPFGVFLRNTEVRSAFERAGDAFYLRLPAAYFRDYPNPVTWVATATYYPGPEVEGMQQSSVEFVKQWDLAAAQRCGWNPGPSVDDVARDLNAQFTYLGQAMAQQAANRLPPAPTPPAIPDPLCKIRNPWGFPHCR